MIKCLCGREGIFKKVYETGPYNNDADRQFCSSCWKEHNDRIDRILKEKEK